jgi:hypothetical protein
MTATPKPNAAEIFFDTAKKVHIPKNHARAMFSIKTARTKRLK